jgi:shikimate dehydrogenase
VTSRLQFAVFGQPIAHSLSPRIHAMFAAQFGIALDYRAIEAGRDDFARALDAFACDGGVGANVTLPLKQDALALCSTVEDGARRCGSVNTLTREDGGWHGDSTDGVGLLLDLHQRQGFETRCYGARTRCLLLGAGGAARAVAFALADAQVDALVIANRTLGRASELAQAVRASGAGGGESLVEAIEWSALAAAGAFDYVLHATSAGHDGAELALPSSLAEEALCYDLSYGTAARPFLQWAKSAGARALADGLGMLVEQAAESFCSWHGEAPETDPVFDALRRERPLAVDGA